MSDSASVTPASEAEGPLVPPTATVTATTTAISALRQL